MKNKIFVLIVLTSLMACKKDKDQDAIVIQSSGNITSSVDAFRHLLGDKLNTSPGAVGGRREINWDGVPDSLLGKPLPEQFFNNTDPGAPASTQRGLIYESDGIFQVSKSNFSEVNAAAANQFAPFSGTNIFTNTSENLWDVGFELPGQDVAASVSGFGVVFADVDIANNTSLEFFNGNKSLGKFFAPVHDPNSKFSFLGVYFKNKRVTKIKVQHGNGLLNSGQKDITDGGSSDLVILDDFLYDEPVKQ
ncbi:MAG: hypothetical protein WCF67_00905 [Chitinophagaceae bacterium]